MVVIEMIQTIFTVVGSFLCELLKIIPIYEQLSSIKEQLISAVTGIPAIVLSVLGIVSTAFVVFIKAYSRK